MFKEVSLRIQGVTPLVQHNGQLADPLNEIAKRMKKVSGKKAKTDADFEEMARLEFYGSLYVSDGKVCIPGEVIEAALIGAARKSKKGQQAQYGLICNGVCDLDFPDKDKTPDELWQCGKYRFTRPVRVQRNRVMRTRAKFDDWGSTLLIKYDDGAFNEAEIKDLVKVAGSVVGLCDWRPKFGLFEVK